MGLTPIASPINAQPLNDNFSYLDQRFRDYAISVKSYGAKGDGVNDDTEAINYVFSSSAGNGRVFFPKGVYLISSPILVNLSSDIEIEMDENAKIITTENFTGKIFQFTSGEDYNFPRFIFRGGTIDASNVVYESGGSNDSLWVQGGSNVLIEGVRFIFGSDYNNKAGDGVALVNCQGLNISNCWFIGAPDSALYITGDSLSVSDDDGRDNIIRGCHFIKCEIGVTTKRQNRRTIITNSVFYKCRTGVIPLEADGLDPGTGYIVSNNTFKYIQANPVVMKKSDYSIIANNRIEDFGYDLDGNPHGAQVQAITIMGSKRCIISGNWIGFKDWTPPSSPTTPFGILMKAATIDSTTYYGIENLITGNTIQDVYLGIREETVNDRDNIVHGNNFYNIISKAVDLLSTDEYKNYFFVGKYALFIDSSGRLRIKNGIPTSDTDGTVVGTQT